MNRNEHEIILGIDPGTKVTGYGLVTFDGNETRVLDYGTVKPPPSLDLPKKYLVIFNAIESLIKNYSPTCIAIESQFFHKNAQSTLKLGMAKGAAFIAGAKYDIPIFEYAPKKAKIAVTGKGTSSKQRVQEMLKLLLKLPEAPTPEDASDAVALAYCHVSQIRFSKMTKE